MVRDERTRRGLHWMRPDIRAPRRVLEDEIHHAVAAEFGHDFDLTADNHTSSSQNCGPGMLPQNRNK